MMKTLLVQSCHLSLVKYYSQCFTLHNYPHKMIIMIMMMIQQLKCKNRWLNFYSTIVKLKITLLSHVNSIHQPQNQLGSKNSKLTTINQTSTSNLQTTTKKTDLNLMTMKAKNSSLKVSWWAMMSHTHSHQKMSQNTWKMRLGKNCFYSVTQCYQIQDPMCF